MTTANENKYYFYLTDNMEDSDFWKYWAILESHFKPSTHAEDINTLLNLDAFHLDENVTSYEEKAVQYLEETQQIDTELYEYIDLDQLGRDLAEQDDHAITRHGYLVLQGEIKQKYTGLQDLPKEFR